MQLASILDQYHDAFQAKHGARLLPSYLRAIEAILQCPTPQAGQLLVQGIDCASLHSHDLSLFVREAVPWS